MVMWKINNEVIEPSPYDMNDIARLYDLNDRRLYFDLNVRQFYYQFDKGSTFYGEIDNNDIDRWDQIRNSLSPSLVSNILLSNNRYDREKFRSTHLSSLDILDKVAGMVQAGVSESDIFPLLNARIEREKHSAHQSNRNQIWANLDQPPTEWVNQDAFLAHRDSNRIYLVGHGKQSDVLDSCSKVLQITNDGEWVDGRIGAGVALEVNGSNKFPYSVIPDNVANDCFEKFNVETNTLQRNDIYLVEYGVNNNKAKIFTYPHSDRSESKVQATTKPYSNLSITKLVENGQPLAGFDVTPDIENILNTSGPLTSEQYQEIQMAMLGLDLEDTLDKLATNINQLEH